MLDGFAVSLATAKVGEAEIRELESLIEQQEEALEQENLKKWATLDDQFHHLIIKFAGNKRLDAAIDIYSDQLYRARLFTINQRLVLIQSIMEHKAIISCMKTNEGAAARLVMQSHRNRARNEILAALDRIYDQETGESHI